MVGSRGWGAFCSSIPWSVFKLSPGRAAPATGGYVLRGYQGPALSLPASRW